MGCGQTKPAEGETRKKSVTFKDPPVDFIEPSLRVAFVSPSLSTRTSEDGIYPPKPPLTRRREIISDDSIFHTLDEHALKVPKSMENSVEALCRYVIKPANKEMEKCRLFYRWITNNISYDTAALFQDVLTSLYRKYPAMLKAMITTQTFDSNMVTLPLTRGTQFTWMDNGGSWIVRGELETVMK